MAFVAIKMGRRPAFIAILRAGVSWLFSRVARSLRINLDMLVARALKTANSPTPKAMLFMGQGTRITRNILVYY
jgi:hypothetical protein